MIYHCECHTQNWWGRPEGQGGRNGPLYLIIAEAMELDSFYKKKEQDQKREKEQIHFQEPAAHAGD